MPSVETTRIDNAGTPNKNRWIISNKKHTSKPEGGLRISQAPSHILLYLHDWDITPVLLMQGEGDVFCLQLGNLIADQGQTLVCLGDAVGLKARYERGRSVHLLSRCTSAVANLSFLAAHCLDQSL